jgi:secreted trypsin-like serine protease
VRASRLLTAFSALLAALTVGIAGASPAGAIAKGATAKEGQFPFAVQLRLDDITRSDGSTYDSACSGALISRTWIITAGHCFHDGNRNRVSGAPRYAVTARLGTANTVDPAAGMTRTVVWVEQSPKNDIAVARLDVPVDGVAPLALGTKAPFRGQLLSFAGWGATSSGGTWSNQLYWGQVKVSRVQTVTALVKGYWPYKDTSACPYDSGAPYVTTASTPVLVAVEKGGPSCPHSSEETTSRVDVVASWVRGVVTDLP